MLTMIREAKQMTPLSQDSVLRVTNLIYVLANCGFSLPRKAYSEPRGFWETERCKKPDLAIL
jgi:hypothetical protein